MRWKSNISKLAGYCESKYLWEIIALNTIKISQKYWPSVFLEARGKSVEAVFQTLDNWHKGLITEGGKRGDPTIALPSQVQALDHIAGEA